MLLRLATILIALSFITSCTNRCADMNLPPEVFAPDRTVETLEIVEFLNLWALEMDEKLNVQLAWSYAYPGVDGYDLLLDFTSQEILDIPGVRRLVVAMMDRLQEFMNSSNVIRNKYHNFVLTPYNVYLSIEFESFFGRFVDPLYVGRLELNGGELTAFYAHTAFEPEPIIFHQHYEPYEVTRTIVLAEKEYKKAVSQKPRKDVLERTFNLNFAPENNQKTISIQGVRNE